MTKITSNLHENMANKVRSRLEQCDLDRLRDEIFKNLQEWRGQSHATIENKCQEKQQVIETQMNDLKKKYDEAIQNLEPKLVELENRENKYVEDATVEILLDSIENDLKSFEQTFLQVRTYLSGIDYSRHICIEKDFGFEKISADSIDFPYSPVSSSAIASNDSVLLMHQYPNLCIIDQDAHITHQMAWNHGWIRDMCWSKSLNNFFIITSHNVYCVDQQLKSLNMLQSTPDQLWFSCTCSDDSLYISTLEWGSSIFEFHISGKLELKTQWKPPSSCQDSDGINDINCNDENLAVLINDSEKHEKRFELKSTKTLETLWMLQLSAGPNIRLFTCCPLFNHQWLVIDGTNLRIYHITKDGKYKNNITYNSVPYRACVFASCWLVISSETDLNIHKLC